MQRSLRTQYRFSGPVETVGAYRFPSLPVRLHVNKHSRTTAHSDNLSAPLHILNVMLRSAGFLRVVPLSAQAHALYVRLLPMPLMVISRLVGSLDFHCVCARDTLHRVSSVDSHGRATTSRSFGTSRGLALTLLRVSAPSFQ